LPFQLIPAKESLMKYIKLMAFIFLFLSAGFAAAAEAPANPAKPNSAPAADRTVKITKIAGTVQLMKDGAVFMTIKPGDAIPVDLDSNVTFHVVDGTIEVEAGGMKINGVSGSEFKPTFSNGAMTVSSQGSGSVEVKSASGYSVVMPSGSEVKMTNTGTTMDVEVQKGRAVVSDPTGGGTRIVNTGETASVPSAPAVVVQAETPKEAPKTEPTEEAAVDNQGGNSPDPTVYVPESGVIVTQEATEATEVSASTP